MAKTHTAVTSLIWSLSLPAIGILVQPGWAGEDVKAPPKAPAKLEVQTIKDIAYYEGKDADPEKHKLDLYLPKGQKDFPVLFFVHGGAWKSGDRKRYPRLGERFAAQGIGTVIISYRLSPKVQHPAHIQDVARAFAWTFRNINKYGGKPDQIFICGHSAGGHLVALLATDESYLKAEKLSLANIRGAIPISGVYRIPPGRLSAIFGDDKESRLKASPLEHVGGKHPPFLIVYADKDFPGCDRGSEAMSQALAKCACETSTLKIKERTHITIIVNLAREDNDPARAAIMAFVREHSAGKAGRQGE